MSTKPIRITFDPNVRVWGGQFTYVGWCDVPKGSQMEYGDIVELYEPESKLYGPARFVHNDYDLGLYYFAVNWREFKIDSTLASDIAQQLIISLWEGCYNSVYHYLDEAVDQDTARKLELLSDAELEDLKSDIVVILSEAVGFIGGKNGVREHNKA